MQLIAKSAARTQGGIRTLDNFRMLATNGRPVSMAMACRTSSLAAPQWDDSTVGHMRPITRRANAMQEQLDG